MLIWLFVLTALYFIACYLLARWYVSPSRSSPVKPPEASAVTIPNGRYALPLWTTPGLAEGKPKSQIVFLLVHGYGGDCQGWTDTFLEMKRRGFEVIVPSMPAHGDSPDPCCGFGVREADCVIAAARWARSQYKQDPTPPRWGGGRGSGVVEKPTIVTVGVSMGAAACWLASQREPELFDAISSEDSFAVLDEAVDKWFSMLIPGGRIALAPVRWFANGMSGIDASAVRPLDAAKSWNGRPALIIHCQLDPLMDASHAERLARAAGTEVWTIPGGGHAEGFSFAGEEYLTRLEALAERARSTGSRQAAVP